LPKTNTVPVKGQVDKKFMDVLLKAMEKNNLDGLDYLEFKQSLQSLAKMPMDEQTRYQSAFAMAQSMGASASHLITTAQHYIDVLETEEKKFEGALEQQVNSKIGAQKSQIASMEKSVKEKAAQIKALTEQIAGLQKKIETTKNSIADSTSKINTTKSNFIASYNLLRGQIEADMNNMKKYLGGNKEKK
jgi:chromosome segregation ATPase